MTIKEIEDFKIELIRYVNIKIDSLINGVFCEGILQEPLSEKNDIFKGKKLVAVILPNNERVELKNSRQVLEVILKDCNINTLRNLVDKVYGKKRKILSSSKDNMVSPVEIAEDIYCESNYDNETKLNILVNLILKKLEYPYEKVMIEYKYK